MAERPREGPCRPPRDLPGAGRSDRFLARGSHLPVGGRGYPPLEAVHPRLPTSRIAAHEIEKRRPRRPGLFDREENLPEMRLARGALRVQPAGRPGRLRRRHRSGRARNEGTGGQRGYRHHRIASRSRGSRPSRGRTEEALRLRGNGQRWNDRNPGRSSRRARRGAGASRIQGEALGGVELLFGTGSCGGWFLTQQGYRLSTWPLKRSSPSSKPHSGYSRPLASLSPMHWFRVLSALSEAQVAELWLDEAERRDVEMESGQVAGISGDEVFRRLYARYRK